MSDRTVAQLIVQCLQEEGVEVVFGIPGEENIGLVTAIADSPIRFVLVCHEQGASFMADVYGRLTGRAGVCVATLGPGAINLLLGVTDAQTDSTPLVAISAQVGIGRAYKESHQIVDLQAMFAPVTKWSDTVITPAAVPEMVRKAFDLAQGERPGATHLAIPQDIEAQPVVPDARPLGARPSHRAGPDPEQVRRAAELLRAAKAPIVLAGHGVARGHASAPLVRLAEQLNLPVATTFMGKGVIPDRHPLALGVVGFMAHDYENFAFEGADLIVSVGYELQEFAPAKINPHGDTPIIHLNRTAQDEDAFYQITADIESDVAAGLEALLAATADIAPCADRDVPIRDLHRAELQDVGAADAFPVLPQRLVAETRAALGDEDIVLVDTGAVKMWMARLYPTQKPLTCIISNGLSTMSFSLPGALGAALAAPGRRVLAVMGDGGFLMNAQEIETAVREDIPLVVLVWVDGSYGLIKWKMDIELGHHEAVDFTNPDFVQYAESFGAHGHRITAADQIRPTIDAAFTAGGVHIVECPVDYRENDALTDRLGEVTVAR